MSVSRPDLAPLLAPRSIAVVGASAQANKVGGMPIRLALENGYEGALYPVHRSAGEIQGLRACESIEAIGEPVDLAIVAVPAAECESVMAQAARSGTRAVVMFSSGFAEVSDEGARAQARIAAIAREAGIALLGPNCLGAMNLHSRVFATFSPVVLGSVPAAGPVGLVSQSGAFGGYAFALACQAGLGIGHWVTTGNEAGVQVADAIAWMAREPSCERILAYLEGARDMDRLRDALLLARDAGKPVTIVKVGHTVAGARAAKLHTGSDTGDAQAYAGLFEACGVRSVRTLGELFASPMGSPSPSSLSPSPLPPPSSTRRRGSTALEALDPRLRGDDEGPSGDDEGPSGDDERPSGDGKRGIAIFSISGGVGIMMADRAEELGFSLPALPDDAAGRVKQAIPFASTVNPIDVTGQVFSQPAVLVQALTDAATCGRYRALAVFLAAAGNAPGVWPQLQACIARLRGDPRAAPLVLSGVLSGEQRAWLEANGCAVFAEPAHAVEAAARFA